MDAAAFAILACRPHADLRAAARSNLDDPPAEFLGRLLAIAGLKAGVTFEIPANCTAAGQPKMDQYHFEAPEAQSRDDLEGVQVRLTKPLTMRLTKPWARLEMRLQKEIEVKRATAARARSLIEDLERQAASLDDTIGDVLSRARVRDPSDCAYPIEARTMGARRDNIKSTIAALSGWIVETGSP
jgi:hypothetical protein